MNGWSKKNSKETMSPVTLLVTNELVRRQLPLYQQRLKSNNIWYDVSGNFFKSVLTHSLRRPI